MKLLKNIIIAVVLLVGAGVSLIIKNHLVVGGDFLSKKVILLSAAMLIGIVAALSIAHLVDKHNKQ